MTIGKIIGLSGALLGLAGAVPAGIDQRVLVVDTAGAPATLGGGTQYADGGTQANPTGNVSLWLDTGNVLRATSAAKPFPVNIVAGAGSGVSITDSAAWTAATSVFVPGGGVFNDSAAALTSGQQGSQRLTTNRAGHVNLRNNAGTEIGTSSNPVRTDPTGGTSQPVSIAQVPAAGALADATANPTTTGIGNYPFVFNGTTWDRLRDTSGANGTTTGAMASGVMVFDTVDAQYKRANSIASGIAGGLTGKNVQAVGGMRYTVVYGAAPTNYAAGAYVHELSDRASVPFTIGGHPNTTTVRANIGPGAVTDQALITVATGTKIIVTGCTVTASNADTVNTSAVIGFGTVNTPTTTGVFLADSGIPPGGGVNRGDGAGILGAGADDEDVRITAGTSTGGSIDVVVTYYTVPS